MHHAIIKAYFLLTQENILLDSMFDVPGSDIVDVIITEETVRNHKPAEYVRRPKESSADSDYESSYEDQEFSSVRSTS